MNEEAKDLLMKYLQVGAEKLEAGMGFVESEIPLVVQEYLSWFWAYSLMCTIGSLLLGIAGAIVLFLFWKVLKIADGYNNETGIAALTGVLGFALTLFSCIGVATNSVNLVKVSVAPRIVILEKLSELTK